ncbi:MAG: hypothetical protein ABIB71_01455 [Candidatus Woesearchaeota archaeon]
MYGKTLALTKEPIHYPKLNTILMVERFIIGNSGEYTRTQLWNKLPQKMIYQTFRLILDYLEISNKITFDVKGKVVWIAVSNKKQKKLLSESVEA